ncbi:MULTISPECIES: integrase family protein [unclassified Shinella]|uniref:tyrosine-type recombinase/integrase n=1 Tax=unclassified Shinella TaxID=2643062 RepID=UPI00234EF684|nr:MULTISPECIES: integrase family protein [unclassified Shinella]MCO5139944.1 integrase arm-type DNA-binding domain-containing protein [Shinella sp.]MDC7257041.1 integrase arm-type DNA-binding domain-containing protein [Shinella sp. YE25]
MQNKVKLTDAVVARAALPEGKSEFMVWDTEVTGFGLRIRGNARSYVIAYRPAGLGRAADMKRVKIGTPQTIKTAAEARKLAFAMLGKVAGGGDPAKDRAEEKRREKARISDLLDRYEEDLRRRNYVARAMVMNLLRKRLKKHSDKDIAELKGADFGAIMEGLEQSGLAGAAEEFRSRCRAFLAFCMTKAKVIDHNPLYGYRRQRATRADRLAKQEHGRALADNELAAVWLAARPDTSFGRFVRFLILSGCRRNEGAGSTRTMIRNSKDDGKVIDFPAAFVKQGRGHRVTITPQMEELLALCAVDSRSPDLLFPSMRTGGQMSGWNKLKAGLVKESGVDFTFHDLRRTFRTGLSRLGVDTETAELALGHARENLIEIYDRGNGSEKLTQAFELWGCHVERIVKAEISRRASVNEGIFA